MKPFEEPSTRSGRKFARLAGDSEVVSVHPIEGIETLVVVSEQTRVLLCAVDEVNFLEGPGKGVYVLKTEPSDHVIATAISTKDSEGLTAVTNKGATHNVNPRRYKTTSRAGKGFKVIKRGVFTAVKTAETEIPKL